MKKIIKRQIRHKIHKAFKAFFRRSKTKEVNGIRIEPLAYYCTLAHPHGQILLSPQPYRRWKQARAAAKRIDYRAFICTGYTLQRLMNAGK